MNNRICRANLAYTLYKVATNKTYTVCRGGRYYKYKHVFLFAQALHIKFNVSLQLMLRAYGHYKYVYSYSAGSTLDVKI